MLVLAPIAAINLLGGFGQFAFGNDHTLPAFQLSPIRFVARAPNALPIRLGPTRSGIVAESLSRFGKTITLRPADNAPVRIDFEATSLGFSLRYVNGLKWEADGEAPPFITWAEGTVGPGVPSAAADWVLLSWQNERPPLLLVFSNPVSLKAEPTENGFSLATGRWMGTVSVRLPLGKRSAATSQAADFGRLLQQVRPILPFASRQAPKALSSAVTPHADGYEVTVRFDAPGAVVPPPAVGNPNVRILSPILEGGPADMAVCASEELRFVVRAPGAFEPGMPVTYRAGLQRPNTSSPEDRILAYLAGNSTPEEAQALSFLAPPMPTFTEPKTSISMPLAPTGEGSYRAALRGLELVAQGKPAHFLDSIFAGIDWVTWQPPGGTSEERENAANALAVAGPYSKSIENRVLAAMANAALSAQSGWQAIRAALYGVGEKPAWLASLRSPLRVMTPGVTSVDAPNGFKLTGLAETTESLDVTVRSDKPIEWIAHTNIARTIIIGIGEQTTIRVWPKTFGEWSLTFRRLEAGSPIPKAAPSPRYNAGRH